MTQTDRVARAGHPIWHGQYSPMSLDLKRDIVFSGVKASQGEVRYGASDLSSRTPAGIGGLALPWAPRHFTWNREPPWLQEVRSH